MSVANGLYSAFEVALAEHLEQPRTIESKQVTTEKKVADNAHASFQTAG
jgi:hypothetical protein